MRFRCLLAVLAMCLLTLAACTETRVIKDNSLDAKFNRGMTPDSVMRAGHVNRMPGT